MATVSLTDLKDMLEVSDTQLNKLVSTEHLHRLAPNMADWIHCGRCLGLEDWQLRDIEGKCESDYEAKTVEMLRVWKKSVLERATYLTLVKVLLEVGNAKLAGQVCKLAKENSPHSPAPKPHTPETPSDEVAILSNMEPELLDHEITNNSDLLLPLVELIPDWLEYSTALGLTDVDRLALQTNTQLSFKMKTVEMLKRWHAVNGYKATYRKLVDAYLLLGEHDLAKQLCTVVREYLSRRRGFIDQPRATAATVTPGALTTDDVARATGLDPCQLEEVFSDDYLLTVKISKLIPDWYELATSLGISPVEREWIQTDSQLSYMMKAMEVIKIWKRHQGLSATYRSLIEAYLRLNNTDLAKQLCSVLL